MLYLDFPYFCSRPFDAACARDKTLSGGMADYEASGRRFRARVTRVMLKAVDDIAPRAPHKKRAHCSRIVLDQ
jgi:hypothetical protein